MFKKSILSSIAILLILIFAGCHHKDEDKSDDVTDPITTYTNADLSGMWFMYITSPSDMIYIVFNGGGIISDWAGFNPATPRGTYAVQATGDYSFTLRTTSGDLGPFTGKINADKVTATLGTGTDNMKKITSFASITGTWAGILTETQGTNYNVVITVDSGGNITALTGLANFQEGKIGVDSDNNVCLFWRANTGDAYNQGRIKGKLNGNQIIGTYGIDSSENPGGTVSLTKQ